MHSHTLHNHRVLKPFQRSAIKLFVIVLALLSGSVLAVWLRRVLAAQCRSADLEPQQLAHTDSRFADVAGLQIHYTIAGHGNPALVLLHGSFLSSFTWQKVIASLAHSGTVVTFDRPAFGLTERSLEPLRTIAPSGEQHPDAYSPEAQADLTVALLDHLGIERAILVGSSTGGTIALLTALRHPQRVQALVLVSAMVYSGYPVSEVPPAVRPLMTSMHRIGPLLVRCMITTLYDRLIRLFWHNPEELSADVLAEYRRALQVRNWDRALWRLILATHALDLAAQVRHIDIPALVIAGDHDRTVPTDQSIRLAEELPDARLVLVPTCGHLPHEERPQAFLQAVTDFLTAIGQ